MGDPITDQRKALISRTFDSRIAWMHQFRVEDACGLRQSADSGRV